MAPLSMCLYCSCTPITSDQYQLLPEIEMRRFRICCFLFPLLPLLIPTLRFLQSVSPLQASPQSTSFPPSCSSETELLVLVESLPLNSNLRRMIRATWGNTSLESQIRIVFLLSDRGDVNSDYQDIEVEEDTIIVNPFFHPILAGLDWSVSGCPQV